MATSDFYSIDPTTGTATLIGPVVGFSSLSGMAFHPTTGVLYAVGFFNNDAHVLLTIDKATGAGTAVGPTNVATASGCSDRVSDIAFRSDGTLYAYADSCDQVGVINTSTGAFTLLGSTGSPDGGKRDRLLAGDVLFHAGGVNVGTLDQTTGVLTPEAALTFPGTCLFGRVNAMDFQPGSGALFVAMRCDSSARRLGTLDTTTGIITDIGASVAQLDAIAFEPSPAIEPPLTDFRDVRRSNNINIGPDLGGTNHWALNFTGPLILLARLLGLAV